MGFERMYTDIVTLIKQDGTTDENIKAVVESSRIIIMVNKQKSVPLIESGDRIRRKMSNGGEETFEVIDPGFNEGIQGRLSHYAMKVRKLGVPQAKSPVQNIAIGPNARINQDNTIDQSSNIVQLGSDVAKILEDLRQEINQCIEDQSQQSKALKVVDTIAKEFKSGSPDRTVVDALVKVLPYAGNIASIASPLLTCLGG